MGLKNGVWQQLSEETGGEEAKHTAAGYWEGWSLHEIIKYILNLDDKSFLNDLWTFYFICTIIHVSPA
jgi:hypothetical protein